LLNQNNLQKESLVNQWDYKVGEMMTSDKRIPLISATGSTVWEKLWHKLLLAV
jgi:aldehyde dehydrogenase (NAD+)